MSTNTHAQNNLWEDYPAINAQLDSAERANLVLMAVDLETDGLGDSLMTTGVLDSLFITINNDNPITDVSDLVTHWLMLKGLIGDENPFFTNLEQDTLSNLVDSTAIALDTSSSMFLTPFNTLDPVVDDQEVILGPDMQREFLEDFLIDQYVDATEDIEDSDTRMIMPSFSELFSASNKVEAYVGVSSGTTNFFDFEFNFDAVSNPRKVIGFRTVPDYDNLLQMKWSFEASWVGENSLNINANNLEDQVLSLRSNQQAIYNLDGDFAMMANPGISIGAIDARILTSFGIEVSRHVPTYQFALSSGSTRINVGNTTACGPQLGTGFSVRVAPNVMISSLATIATGIISNSDYTYNSFKATSSMVIGRISVNYAMTVQNYADDNNKRLDFNTISIGYQL